MAFDSGSINEIADTLKASEDRSIQLFNNELAFVVDWEDAK